MLSDSCGNLASSNLVSTIAFVTRFYYVHFKDKGCISHGDYAQILNIHPMYLHISTSTHPYSSMSAVIPGCEIYKVSRQQIMVRIFCDIVHLSLDLPLFIAPLRSTCVVWPKSALLQAVNLERKSSTPRNLVMWTNTKIPLYRKKLRAMTSTRKLCESPMKISIVRRSRYEATWRCCKLLGYWSGARRRIKDGCSYGLRSNQLESYTAILEPGMYSSPPKIRMILESWRAP